MRLNKRGVALSILEYGFDSRGEYGDIMIEKMNKIFEYGKYVGRSKKKEIPREQALRIANDYVKKYPERGLTFAQKIFDFEEINFSKPQPYGVPSEEISKAWIAYCEPNFSALQSSLIIVVSKETGEVIYSGSADDEG